MGRLSLLLSASPLPSVHTPDTPLPHSARLQDFGLGHPCGARQLVACPRLQQLQLGPLDRQRLLWGLAANERGLAQGETLLASFTYQGIQRYIPGVPFQHPLSRSFCTSNQHAHRHGCHCCLPLHG
jgi:hypothetical protein